MSRTKKATQSAAAGEAGPPTRYHPGEGYQPVEGTTIGSGALSAAGEELWLIRVPREVRMDQLDGTTLQLQDGHAAGAMGSLAIKHGAARWLAVSPTVARARWRRGTRLHCPLEDAARALQCVNLPLHVIIIILADILSFCNTALPMHNVSHGSVRA
mmetsp:Transcript_28515/g.71444  ORF Transcript_28515/g.71444 Transcript_28515/m.71444 type:complete len:157 (+) Transcript_28515:259-729(+)